MKKTILVVTFMLGIVACSESDLVATFDSGEISKQDFAYYIDSKGVQNKSNINLTSILEGYSRREALTAQILETDELDLNSVDQKVNDYRNQLVLNEYFDKFISERVTPDAVKNYYTANIAQYEEEKAQLAHILFRIRSGMSEAEIEATKTKAYATHAKLIAESGTNKQLFEQLAKTESSDKISAPKGGSLGWVKNGSIDPNFSSAAFSLKAGEISEPVRSVFGFHLIKVLEAPQKIKVAFEDVKGEIHHSLRAKAKQAEIQRLLKDANIEIIEDNLVYE